MTRSLVTFLSRNEVWLVVLGLAAFLSLYWVLRGAPAGQGVDPEEDEEAPRGGYRDRVVAAICVGMLLIGLGGYLAFTRGIAISLPAFLLGFGTVYSLVVINERHRHASPTLRRTVDLSTSALNVSLFAGILIVVNVIAFRYGGQALDLTQERAFSLSSLSLTQLSTLKTPVTFTTFFGRGRLATPQFDRVRQILELYRAANPEKVRLNHVDPYRDLSQYETLVKRVPDVDVTQGGGVVVEYGEGESTRRAVVRNVDLFDAPRPARFDPDADSFPWLFKGEDAVTSALIRLREGKMTRVVFATGHGESSLDDATTPSGMGLWKSRLNATGMEVVPLNLLTQPIPEDVALVVIAGPKKPFNADEVSRLKAYTDRKGPLLILLGDNETTGLDETLRGFGIEMGKGFVVEPRLNYRQRPELAIVQVLDPRHPIMSPLTNERVVMVRAAPLKVAEASKSRQGTISTALIRSTPQSWAEPDLTTRQAARNDQDESGPLTLGVAVNDQPEPGKSRGGLPRLVVFSSRYLADNAMVQLFPANLDLVMNAANWLRGRPDAAGIAPTTHETKVLTSDPGVRARLVLVPTVMAVLLIMTLGVSTYLARRE
ncbi:MAG: hypothetical protein NVSMB9_24900 [Isosphaeraceae bacterium]